MPAFALSQSFVLHLSPTPRHRLRVTRPRPRPPLPSHRTPRTSTLRASATPPLPPSHPSNGLNINAQKYKSQRSIVSADKDVSPSEINSLLLAASKPARDEAKWQIAIDNSYVVVHARLLGSGKLVGFARATSDRALNGTIWDLVTDPSLPDQATMARNVISYLLREIRRTVPTCSIALISDPDDIAFFEAMEFVGSPDGITSMVLSPEYEPAKPMVRPQD